ncbi:MAG: glucose 1-dehydrogenase [Deltaproteobacteria bacterium]|nr:glucose 1-dehydrogenase [Deltaproteobacteria bacterium]
MSLSMFDLTGKVAVVTGASRGLGRAIALGLARAGANVVAASRSQDLLERVVAAMAREGARGMAVPCDIGVEADLDLLVERSLEQFGGIDILVNNAGISPWVKRSEEVSRREWDQVIDVNLTGTFLLTQKVGRRMIQRSSGGRIINIVSVGGMVALIRQISYCVAKAGLIQMTRVLAAEWSGRYDINVNAIAPSYFATDLTHGMRQSEKIRRNLLSRTPKGRFGDPNEVVGAAIFLASEASSYVTGSVLMVDGVWTAT